MSNHDLICIFQVNAINLLIIHLCRAWLWLSRIFPCLVWCWLLQQRWAIAASFFWRGPVFLFVLNTIRIFVLFRSWHECMFCLVSTLMLVCSEAVCIGRQFHDGMTARQRRWRWTIVQPLMEWTYAWIGLPREYCDAHLLGSSSY